MRMGEWGFIRMSRICGGAQGCPFAPEQDSGGCPCADLCPGYCEPCRVTTSNRSEPEYLHIIHDTMVHPEILWTQNNRTITEDFNGTDNH